MSVSKPIVATAVGGVPEAIEHERNGLLTPPSQPRRLAEAIQRLVADPTSAQRLGASARETVEERFLACDVAARYAALYDQLVGIERGRCVAECC
jgi:starch synthase